jgi:exodeoxyribonuclease VII large subunit
MAVPVKAELEAGLANLHARLQACTTRGIDRKRQALRGAARALPSPDQLLALPRRRFDEATSRLGRALTVSSERKRARFQAVRLTPVMLSRRITEARKHNERDLARAQTALRAVVRQGRARLARSASRLTPDAIARRQAGFAQQLVTLSRRADNAADRNLERLRARLTQADRLLSTLNLSDGAILERGYALVIDADGKLVRRAAEVTPGMAMSIRFADGTAKAHADGGKPLTRQAKPKEASGQGSLF